MNLKTFLFGNGERRQNQQRDESRDRVAERISQELDLTIQENLRVTDRLQMMAKEMRGLVERASP
jgi:hypothetical protein